MLRLGSGPESFMWRAVERAREPEENPKIYILDKLV